MQADDYSHFHQYWIQESLKDLKQSLNHLNIPLLMRHGEFTEALDMIQHYYTLHQIVAHEETGNHLTYMRDLAMIQYCATHTLPFVEYPTNAVVRRLRSRDDRGNHHKERILAPLIHTPCPQAALLLDVMLVQHAKETFKTFIAVQRPASSIYARDNP
jgi:deoxyribodipyrimidine photo-lyase